MPPEVMITTRMRDSAFKRVLKTAPIRRRNEPAVSRKAAVERTEFSLEGSIELSVIRIKPDFSQAGHLRTRWRPAVDGYRTIKFDRDSAQELLNSGLIRNAAGQYP